MKITLSENLRYRIKTVKIIISCVVGFFALNFLIGYILYTENLAILNIDIKSFARIMISALPLSLTILFIVFGLLKLIRYLKKNISIE